MPARIDSRVVLPAPFGPDHRHELAAARGERDAAQRLALAEALDEVARLEHAARRRPSSRSHADSLAESPAVKLLFVGDVVGGIGRRTLAALLPGLRERHEPDFVVVNGENSAGGVGITEKTARELLETGRRRDHARQPRLPPPRGLRVLDREERIVRPANYPKGSPGRGHTVVERDGARLGVVNLSGLVFLEAVALAVRRGRRAAGRAARPGRPRARGLPRRGHEREGGDGLARRRPRDRRAWAPTRTCPPPTPACCRAAPPTSPTWDDRPARRRDRREARAGARALPHAHPGAVRDLRRGPVAERGAGRGGRRRPGARRSSSCCCRRGCSSRTASASTASRTTLRSATSARRAARASTTSK